MTVNEKIKKNIFKRTAILVAAAVLLAQPLSIPLAGIASGSETGSDSGGEAIISTGDGDVQLGIENDVNQNDYSTGSAESGLTGEGGEGVEGEEARDVSYGSGSSTGETIINKNEAELDNEFAGAGNSGANGTGTSTGDTAIMTGGLDISAKIDNDVNGNTVNTACGDECGGASSSDPAIIEVENDNTASTTNGVELAGNTGENNVGTTTGPAAITTGDIDVMSIIINFINTNFVGPGREFFMNIFSHLAATLDFSGYGEEPYAGAGGSCAGTDCVISVNNANEGEMHNGVSIDANTGLNEIIASGSPAVIETGDINIISDIVNIGNLNITGNDWFFAVINVFGALEGDVILPPFGAEEGLPAYPDGNAENLGQLIVANSNFADVVNDIDVIASTGENAADGDAGETIIRTGEAEVDVKSLNFVNYNLTGDGWRVIRVNLFGTWDGDVHGLPDGYEYFEDEDGITIYNESFLQDIFNDAYAKLAVNNENSAEIANEVTINADSGRNSILHGGGAHIDTGDVYVRNALLNFINANFTGNDWEFAMVNVFGDWQGNLAFGRPNLWITESASGQEPVNRGGFITYTFLFGNKGDGFANNVKITDDFDELLALVAETAGGENGDGAISWDIGSLPPNSQGSLTYTVQARGDIPYGNSELANKVVIGSDETDRDYADNSAGGMVQAEGGRSPENQARFLAAFLGDGSGGSGSLPGLSIIKTNDAEGAVRPGDLVNYRLIIRNTGSAHLEDVLVSDIMTDEAGETEVNRDYWNLETLYAGEEVVIEYTIEIKANIVSGTYVNEAVVEGLDRPRERYIAAVGSSKIKAENPEPKSANNGDSVLLELNQVSRTSLAEAGDTVEYELIITNNGGRTAKNILVSASLPDGLTFASNGGNFYRWDLDFLNPGQFENLSYKIQTDSAAPAGVYTIPLVAKADNDDRTVIVNSRLNVGGGSEMSVLGFDSGSAGGEAAAETDAAAVIPEEDTEVGSLGALFVAESADGPSSRRALASDSSSGYTAVSYPAIFPVFELALAVILLLAALTVVIANPKKIFG